MCDKARIIAGCPAISSLFFKACKLANCLNRSHKKRGESSPLIASHWWLHRGLENDAVGFLSVLIQLIEVQVAIGIAGGFIHLQHELLILIWRRQFT